MIIIRTIHNLSYLGIDFNYEQEFLNILINKELNIYIHIPRNEISEIIYKNESVKNISEFLMEK